MHGLYPPQHRGLTHEPLKEDNKDTAVIYRNVRPFYRTFNGARVEGCPLLGKESGYRLLTLLTEVVEGIDVFIFSQQVS